MSRQWTPFQGRVYKAADSLWDAIEGDGGTPWYCKLSLDEDALGPKEAKLGAMEAVRLKRRLNADEWAKYVALKNEVEDVRARREAWKMVMGWCDKQANQGVKGEKRIQRRSVPEPSDEHGFDDGDVRDEPAGHDERWDTGTD